MHQNNTFNEIIIIGAGMSGICMGAKLLKANINNFLIIDKADDVAGTWHYNTYPGSGCDVRSTLYSYSFNLNPNWSRMFSLHDEIKAYFRDCVNKFKLQDHIQLSKEVREARFSEETGIWTLILMDDSVLTCRILISGLGQLNNPYLPEFKGADNFLGQAFHSARWNHDLDLTNKKVSIIGNAASALQFIPHIVKSAESVNVFQRSPNYVIPRNDRAYSSLEKKLFCFFPFFQRLHRLWIFLRQEMFYGVIANYKLSQKILTNEFKRYIAEHITDKDKLKKLTPTYPIGCKRILVSDDYYQAMNNAKLKLVTDPIDRFDQYGLTTQNGVSYESDVIIYATGFKTNEFLSPISFIGKQNCNLDNLWENGAESYKGICIKNFPNFFMLYGPNTNLGSNSIIFMVEQQVKFIIKCIKKVKSKNFKSIEIKESIFDQYNLSIQKDMLKTVWLASCDSWYKNKHGKVVNNWPKSPTSYYFHMKFPNFSHFNFL
jgi:cation diffusion facilitator CzcD-associated flavoprotein CzcO